jgi:hypothetical protein
MVSLCALVSFAPLELQSPYVKSLTILDLKEGNQHTTEYEILQWTATTALNALTEGKTLHCAILQ